MPPLPLPFFFPTVISLLSGGNVIRWPVINTAGVIRLHGENAILSPEVHNNAV